MSNSFFDTSSYLKSDSLFDLNKFNKNENENKNEQEELDLIIIEEAG